MSRVLTNNTSFAYALEASIGTLPGSPIWKLLEPNTINQFGSTITTVPRNPISKMRQRRKGTITDLESAVEYEADATMDSLYDFVRAFMFSKPQSESVMVRIKSGALSENLAASTTLDDFTHDALTAAIPQNSMIKTRGFTNAINNGIHRVDTGSTTTSTPVVSTNLITETPTNQANASLEVCGFYFTDLTWTDATNTLGSAGVDLTTLGLSVGQFIRVGDGTSKFTNGEIYGRIVSAPTANAIVLDKVTNISTGTLEGGGDEAASTVVLLYGQFFKNVSVDDANYTEDTFHIEGAFPDLGGPSTDEYEYAKGNFLNTMAFNLPLTDKATITFAFIGTDTEVPTTTRKTNAATPQEPTATEALNTSADIARLRVTKVDESGLTTDFKSATININNNVSAEKVLGTLGAKYMNAGNFEVDIEAEIVFTNGDVLDAIRNNTTVTMEFAVENNDGGVWFDIPSMNLGNGGKSFPVNESVLMGLSGMAFKDNAMQTSLGVSMFPHLP
jgi:hypothetical protein